MLERITNWTISRRSSPNGSGGACGKRLNARSAAALTSAEPANCPRTSPRIASVTPKCAPITSPIVRSSAVRKL